MRERLAAAGWRVSASGHTTLARMNFYGHCWLAGREGAGAAFAFGSMLPDFAGMSGARLEGADDAEVAAGIAHHHAVDAVFHAAPTFLSLCTESGARLDAAGVGWGTARAVAHVGVELLLDGVLLLEGSADPLYLGALEAAGPEGLGGTLRWRKDDAAVRFERLRARLASLGTDPRHGSPEVVAERLDRALAPRPRLAIAPEARPLVDAEMARLHPEVHARASALLAEVERGLDEAHADRRRPRALVTR